MEKYIIRVSYWFGLACTVVAVIIRGLDAAGFTKPSVMVQEGWHMSFYKGAVLCFLTAIATYAYTRVPQQK